MTFNSPSSYLVFFDACIMWYTFGISICIFQHFNIIHNHRGAGCAESTDRHLHCQSRPTAAQVKHTGASSAVSLTPHPHHESSCCGAGQIDDKPRNSFQVNS